MRYNVGSRSFEREERNTLFLLLPRRSVEKQPRESTTKKGKRSAKEKQRAKFSHDDLTRHVASRWQGLVLIWAAS
jgi:hypothetical protein